MSKLRDFVIRHQYESVLEFVQCWLIVPVILLALFAALVFGVYSCTDSYHFQHIEERQPILLFFGDETLVLTEYSLNSLSRTVFTYDDAGNPIKIHYVSSSNLSYLPYVEEVSP